MLHRIFVTAQRAKLEKKAKNIGPGGLLEGGLTTVMQLGQLESPAPKRCPENKMGMENLTTPDLLLCVVMVLISLLAVALAGGFFGSLVLKFVKRWVRS